MGKLGWYILETCTTTSPLREGEPAGTLKEMTLPVEVGTDANLALRYLFDFQLHLAAFRQMYLIHGVVQKSDCVDN